MARFDAQKRSFEILRISREFLAKLPPELLDAAAEINFSVEPKPEAELDPDLLGLFDGPTREEIALGNTELPPRIILYSENLWDEAEGDPARFEEEVEITLFHELGHYLGFDEEDLVERDLD